MAKRIQVGGRIESKEVGGIVTGAAEILDDAKGKKQSVINGETDDELVRLDQSKQDNLTFDNAPTEGSDNPVKSGGLYTAQQAILLAIAAINELIPSAASTLNQLADKAFVNSSISTNTATFRGTSAAGLNEQQFLAWANGLEHDLNDYVFWQTSDAAGNTLFKRYKWNGTEWAYEYTLNNSTFTAEQWEAIQSGITALLVAKLRALPTAEQLIQSFDSKQDVLTFDNVPTLGSTNPVKSSGIYNVIKAITDLIPAEATAQNQLADKADVAAKIVAAIPSWKGQYDAITDLQAVTGAKAGDMGCVKTTDSDGHAVLTFYQYSAQGAWVVYYTLRHYAQNKPATTGTTGDYQYNGMGRIELQKNIVNGVNTLTQAMLTQQNTIYVMQYDYVLAADVTIPSNSILDFVGGSISGAYTITGQNTGIKAGLTKILGTDVILAGSWNVADAYPEWFGAVGDGVSDDTAALQKVCKYFTHIVLKNNYKCTQSIDIINDYTTVEGRGTIYFTSSLEISGKNCDNLIFRNFKVVSLSGYSGIGLWCGNDSFISDINPNTKIHYNNILIDHVEVDNFSSGYKELEFGVHGIFVRTGAGASISNIIIQNCVSRGSGCDPNVLNTCNGSDNIYIGSYSNQAAPMENVRILNNYCEYAGRQNLSLASDDPSCITNVVVSGNTFKDSEMAGLDIEVASNISIIGNTFINSGKYKGYYDQADSVKNDNFALQSAIAGSTKTTSIVSCKFYNCKNVVSSTEDALLNDCYIYDTPITLLDAAQLTVSCEDCTIINTEESAAVIYVYSVGYLYKFKNCTISLAKDSYIYIIGNSLFDNCQIGRASSTASNTLLRCTGSFKNKLIGCSISAPSSSIISTGSSTSVHIEQCEITGEGLDWNNASGDIYINGSNLNIAYICGAYNISVRSFRINNCGISLKYKILIPLTNIIQISDNVINFAEFNDAASTGVDNLIFFWSALQFTKLRIENNRISGIADSVTLFVKERNAGVGYGAVCDIVGNMLFGNDASGRTITQIWGRTSSTAASVVQRNSLNGVDLTQ